MNKKSVLITVVVMVFLCGFGSVVYGDPWPGSGDANDPYQIHNAQQMQAIGADPNYWGAHFKLMKDIDLSAYTGTSFNIIGNDVNAFTGVFDGDGHTISNFTYDSNGVDYIGLFGYIYGPNTEVKNLGLIDPNIHTNLEFSYTGSLAGYLDRGTIRDCYVEGGYVRGSSCGGLVGLSRASYITSCYSTASVEGVWGRGGGLVGANDGDISDSYSTGSVTGVDGVGGLVGSNNYGEIQRCYSSGSVSGDDEVGGLIGINYNGNISNSYSTGSVTGDDYVGGLAGGNSWDGHITNCYSTGSVAGDYGVGGLVGKHWSEGGEAINSYWDVESSGIDTSYGGVGLTTGEMQSVGTYTFWGCGGLWTIDNGNDYPHLAWEGKPGEIIDLGCGTEEDPYQVYKAIHMQVIGADVDYWDAHFVLMADIDLGEYTWMNFNIIGSYYDQPFTGVFDGNGHTISNFTYVSSEMSWIGFFGWIDDPNAEIKNLGLIDPNVIGSRSPLAVGSLVGFLEQGSVSGCYIEGGSVTGPGYVGGLVGSNSGEIQGCYSTGSVTGCLDFAGGLVGVNGSNIMNCCSTCSVTGEDYVGGLVGGNGGNVMNCCSTGDVTGVDMVGGLLGGSGGSIFNCYSAGSVAGDVNVGGLVGHGYNVDYIACFWDSDVNPDVNGIGNTTDPNVAGLPTVLMQTESTFTDAGWDFVGETVNGTEDIWKMNCEGMSYPKLSWWEPALGDFICPDGVDMIDFAILGDAWMSEAGDLNWEAGCDISEPADEVIDGLDLGVFVGNWLEGF